MDPELRKLTKRTLLVTVCLLMVLSPFYAAPSSVQATAQFEPRYGGTLRIAIPGDPGGFNPLVSPWKNRVPLNNLFSKPYRFDDRYNLVGYAMQEYPTITSEPGFPSVYTMELKDNIKRHDDTPMTANDVKFTFETMAWSAQNHSDVSEEINNRLAEPYYGAYTLSNLKKIELEIIQTRNNLQNVIDSISEIMMVINSDNKVTMWNRAVEDITFYKRKQIINNNLKKLKVFERPDELMEYLKNVE